MMSDSSLLKELGEQIGIDLEFDENNQCLLRFDENMWISIHGATDGYVFYGMLGDFPDQEENTFWKGVLSINKELADLGEGAIALEDSTDSLLLIKKIDTRGMDGIGLRDALARFSTALERVMGFFVHEELSEDDETDPDASQSNGEEHETQRKGILPDLC